MFSYLSQLLDDVDTQNERYRLVARLEGHGGPINTFSFNLNGTLLASGGDDEEVRIWDLHTFRRNQTLADRGGTWGQITCIKFLNVESTPMGDWLCFGTGRGHLLLYCRQRKTIDFVEALCLEVFGRGDSVEAFAFDPHFERVALSSHYGEVRMLHLQVQGTNLVELWKTKLDAPATPRALMFVDRGAVINIFTMENGVMHSRDAETSAMKQARDFKSSIGNVSVCSSTGNILIDNVGDGFDLYSVNRSALIRSFPVKSTRKFVKAGVFAEGGRTIVCGSDHGKIYVFGITDTKPKQELLHGNRTQQIQTVATHATPNIHLIATGASDGKHDIYLWSRSTKQPSKSKSSASPMDKLIFINIFFLCIFAWATSVIWLPVIKSEYDSISTRFQMNSYVRLYDTKTEPRSPRFDEVSQKARTPGLAELLYDLDDETYRRIFKILPPLTEDEVRHDEGRPAVNVPMKNDLRRVEEKPAQAVRKLQKSTADDHQCKEPKVVG